VSVELLLDGVLADDDGARRAFVEALGCELAFADEGAARRWAGMLGRLEAGAVPRAYGDPDFVCARVVGALRGRPRLALAAGEVAVLRACLQELAPRVRDAAPSLLDRLSL
jgi:hypothetical protein